MPVNLPDLGMSALEKQKIRNRSNVVARHVNPAQDQKPFVEAQVWRIAGDDTNLIHFQSLQLGALFQSLSINNQRGMQRPRDVGMLCWVVMCCGVVVIRSIFFLIGGEWAGEFEATQRADQWAEEYRDHHPWLQGFQEWQRNMGTRTWDQEYEQFDERQFRQFQNAWKDSVDEGWRNEFDRVKG